MKAYPAADDGPLCRLMDDPAFWVALFTENDDRQAVKRALKRLPNRGGLGLNVIKVERDDVIGRALHALMRTPHGRDALHHELAKRVGEYDSPPENMVAQTMFQRLSGREEWFKPLEEHLVQDEARSLRFLAPEGLAAWLEVEGAPGDPEKQRWLAGLVAAFALVSPNHQESLIEALVALGAPYDAWFEPAG